MRRDRTTRRDFLKAAGCVGAAGAGRLLGAQAPEADAAKQPNVIFLLIDDMGYADPSCCGNPVVKTPHIDRLAAQGTRLTQFYVNSPICSPSRVAVTTGQYPARHLIHSYLAARSKNRSRGMTDFLSPDVLTMPDVFKAAGYATAHFGKWHMGGGRDVQDAPTPQAYGFDESLVNFEGMGERIEGPKHGWTQTYVDRSIDFIRRNKNRPFFLRLFPNDVHDKHVPPPGTDAKWASVTKNPYEQKFFAVLEEMDRQLGRVVDEVDKLGLSERTLIVFTSDNGPTDWPRYYKEGWTPPGFAGPFRGRKWSLYEGGIRMPFIVRWTGKIPAGRTDEQTVSAAMDLLPTLCRMTGLDIPKGLDGQDVSSAWMGTPRKRQTPIFWEYGRRSGYLPPGNKDFHSPPLAVREGDWKLLMHQDGSGVELYNLADDPKETRNRAAAEPTIAVSLKKKLAAWRASLPELPADQAGRVKTTIGYDPEKGIITPKGKPAPRRKARAVTLDLNVFARLCKKHGATSRVRNGSTVWTFDGKDDYLDLPKAKAPSVAGRTISIQAEITPQGTSGVILAHGGDKTGYALYLKGGKAVFSVCVDWKRTTVTADAPLTEGRHVLAASVGGDGAVTLSVDGQPATAANAAGPLDVDPGDSIQIGADQTQPVGTYEGSNYFHGEISRLVLEIKD